MTYSAALAAEIRAQMGRRQISGRELARRIALRMDKPPSFSTVARMLNADYPWDVDTLEAASGVLSVSMVDLIARAGDAMADNRWTLPSGEPVASSQVRGLQPAAA